MTCHVCEFRVTADYTTLARYRSTQSYPTCIQCGNNYWKVQEL